jgi:hypothetical protein
MTDMTEGIGEIDDGTGITTGAATMTETDGGAEVVTVMITTTGGGDAIAMIDMIVTAGIAGNNRRTRNVK